MQIFRLVNSNDEILANIIELDNGKAVTSWETTQEPKSVVVWDSLSDARKIHSKNPGWKIVGPVATIH